MPKPQFPCFLIMSLVVGTAFLVSATTPGLAEKIDWEGSLNFGNGSAQSNANTRSASRGNLPGVRSSPTREVRNQDCPDGTPRSRSFDSVSSSDGCNRKAPLIIFRDGNVGGLLSVFPR